MDTIITDIALSASEVRNFSALSHAALDQVKGEISTGAALIGRALALLASGEAARLLQDVIPTIWALLASAAKLAHSVPGFLLDPSAWAIPDTPRDVTRTMPEFSAWSGQDRVIAIICGYLTLALAAALYLRRGAPLSSGPVARQWEAAIVDLIHQASGVMKVVVIIGIEMLLFPLYCGLLLDAALLPLFKDATIVSRMDFTCNYPVTSVFVHWFVGTGYMFHFALFVSMCRKVMRRGVLCKFFS
jgi:E3 ubiquitin-protein ligase MARCH6